MLTCKDCVSIKDVKQPYNYDRLYFEFSGNDPVEDFTKTVTDKKTGNRANLKNADGTDWKGTCPKAEKTTETAASLVSEMLTFFVSERKLLVNPDETPEDYASRADNEAWLKVLECVSKGLDSTKRNNIQANNKPIAVIADPQEAFDKLVRTLQQCGLSEPEAIKQATATLTPAVAA